MRCSKSCDTRERMRGRWTVGGMEFAGLLSLWVAMACAIAALRAELEKLRSELKQLKGQ